MSSSTTYTLSNALISSGYPGSVLSFEWRGMLRRDGYSPNYSYSSRPHSLRFTIVSLVITRNFGLHSTTLKLLTNLLSHKLIAVCISFSTSLVCWGVLFLIKEITKLLEGKGCILLHGYIFWKFSLFNLIIQGVSREFIY